MNKGSESKSRIGLGIDAGGTYTDTVVFDLDARRVLAKAKSLTTYYDLMEGIRGALAQLPESLLKQVEVTALSTTLATNAIVEGRGQKVGLITLSPFPWWAEERIGHAPFVDVPGSVDVNGQINQPLDEVACRSAVKYLVEQEQCAAIAVAGFAVERNPSQCNRVREIIREMYDVPVVCSHEISRTEYSIDAAKAAVVNAKLLPVIQDLLIAVHQALKDFGIHGKLMVVKGDGTIVDESVARERPVETVLSGPAASVSGARVLAGLENALVLDIGGTTTDCAVVQDGYVAISKTGARIGSWVLGVDAIDMSASGLGGDSRIDYTFNRKITIGPVRCLPFSYLAYEYASVLEALKTFDIQKFHAWNDASPLDFLVLSGNGSLDLTCDEAALVNLLRNEGPMSVLKARTLLDAAWYTLLPTSRLELCGMLKRAALTPTDLLHISGEFTQWNVEAAHRALEIFSYMFGKPAAEIHAMARTAITRRLYEEIIRKETHLENPKLHEIPTDWVFLLNKAFSNDGNGMDVKFALRKPIVAIGAPAQALAPAVAEHLGAEILIPEHAEVANAVGAIGSEVVVRERILIRPGGSLGYTLHGAEEFLEFDSLEGATQKAVDLCQEQARRKAVEAGAVSTRLEVKQSDHTGSVADGSHLFLQRHVTAIAAGRFF